MFLCEGCQTEIKLKDKENKLFPQYQAGEGSHKKTFLFCDLYCETLRKYKEAIRQYAFEYEFIELYQTMPCNLNDPDRRIHLFAMKDTLLVVDSALSRNAKVDDKKPHKPRIKKSKQHPTNTNNPSHHNNPSISRSPNGLYPKSGYNITDAGVRRERRLALLNLWREAVEDSRLPQQSLEVDISTQQTIAQLDESRELPELLRYMDVTTFGRPLWYFCVDQLSTKDRPPLWCILEFLATELPTAMAINLLERTRDALVRFQVEPLDNVCLKIIAASTYPIATALYLAAFMDQNGIRDSSRLDQFTAISTKYIDIATHLLSQIESDHLLAILIEIPSNIDNMSILDIVIRFKLEGFLEFHRLQPIFMNMWMQYQYLDPSKPFRNREADSIDVFDLCKKSAASFYYSPVGAFTLQCTTYIIHVMLVSIVTHELLYPYKPIKGIELVVWIFNAGFVLYEISELAIRKTGYFQYYSNWVGFITSIIWVILAFMRFLVLWRFLDIYCNIENCPSNEAFPCPADPDFDPDIHDDPCYRNTTITKVYMIFWSIQVVLLWCRMAALLQRNRHAGPLLRMIMNMFVEIASFALLLSLFLVGFVLATYYIVGQDIPPNEEGGGLGRITSVFLYDIQALLAAQEWSVIVSDEDHGFDSDRSIMVETCMVILSIFGTLLLMNLFIALLTITYESEKQSNKLKTNFARITHTIELDRKSAVMPPPLNLLVFVLALLYGLFEYLILILFCGYWSTKLQVLYPLKYSLYVELKKKEKESKHTRRGSVYTLLPPEGSLAGSSHDKQQHLKFQSDDDSESDEENVTQTAVYRSPQKMSAERSISAYWTKDYRGDVHCGCFVRSTAESKERNLCKNLSKQLKQRNRQIYCRHCRHSISQENGDIDRYFELFKYWQLLDEDDKKLLRLRLSKRNICPHCYRCYKAEKKKPGLSRFQVILEVMSYYVFRFLIWWWLLAILAIPALIMKFYQRLNRFHSETVTNYNAQIMTNVSKLDPEYRLKVEQVIKQYNDKDDDGNSNNNNNLGNNMISDTKTEHGETDRQRSPSPLKKYETLHPKHKTRTELTLKMVNKSIEDEFNDLYVDNIQKQKSLSIIDEDRMTEKFRGIESQIDELRNLILTQNVVKQSKNNYVNEENADSVSPQRISPANRRKRVTFNMDMDDTDNDKNEKRATATQFEFDTMTNAMNKMKMELVNIKQRLEDQKESKDEEEVVGSVRTPPPPRVPSHARGNAPIAQLNIDSILTSPADTHNSTAL